ncbi:MAG: FAD-dependent thymidylate synthase [Oscillospiraceae bacterium]
MRVILLSHTPMPALNIANAAKLCYSKSDILGLREKITDEKANSFVNMLSSMGHESPIEHASFTFGIEGVSRSLLAQITRHRMASFSVKSQRYVNEGKFEFIIPPHIEADERAKKIYLEAMDDDSTKYNQLAAILKENHIKTLMKKGESLEEASKKAEKMSIEDARYVLPNSCETKMITTMNARSLVNFFKHRCCERAQWEIKNLADEMLKLVYEVAPSLFEKAGASCVSGPCPEGSMYCGKIKEVREFYDDLKVQIKK